MGPGEEEDFRLVTVDGNTTIRGTDQNKGVVFILREREREREREKGGREREGRRGGGKQVKESTTISLFLSLFLSPKAPVCDCFCLLQAIKNWSLGTRLYQSATISSQGVVTFICPV